MLVAWTVRTEAIIRRSGVSIETPVQAVLFAEAVLRGEVRNAGKKTATELFRAAGFGVYEIYNRLKGQVRLEAIKDICNRLDHAFHD